MLGRTGRESRGSRKSAEALNLKEKRVSIKKKKKKGKKQKLDAGIHIARRTLFWKGRDSNYVYSIAPVLSSLSCHRGKRMMG